ncbi:unnamed protein product [Fraxinus pennsylvanica]|uniref:BHLH domain-containing protein n=1 Tax=Fraxinus pennsylvanica TaxID=56036 RepID=A0AAD1YW41_9LAMI|nr:unnamed protein product [Fraxinus pennsylvanica]
MIVIKHHGAPLIKTLLRKTQNSTLPFVITIKLGFSCAVLLSIVGRENLKFDNGGNDKLSQGCERHSSNLSTSDKKRKRFDDASRLTHTENADVKHGRNEIAENEDDDKLAHKLVVKSCSKIVGKESIHKSNSKKAPNAKICLTNSTEDRNKDYVQARAKRGEATSRHSLAERIRRERISERMKVLQDLVPGCDKITGKAIMLDEIINYVLSLQHQVEFLSMKLAAVDSRQKSGLGQFLLEDIHHSQEGIAATIDTTEMGSFYSLPDTVSQVTSPTLTPSPNVSLFEPLLYSLSIFSSSVVQSEANCHLVEDVASFLGL